MLVKTYGSAVHGVDATTITVEVNIDKGINFSLVGLPDSAVKESQHRIDAALNNTGYKIPGKKITINKHLDHEEVEDQAEDIQQHLIAKRKEVIKDKIIVLSSGV